MLKCTEYDLETAAFVLLIQPAHFLTVMLHSLVYIIQLFLLSFSMMCLTYIFESQFDFKLFFPLSENDEHYVN